MNPKLAFVPNETSKIYSTWFLSPEQHAAEILLYIVLHAWPMFSMITSGVPGWDLPYPAAKSDDGLMQAVDTLVFLVFCASFSATIYFKYNRDRLWFLWCPCHVFTIILLICGASRSYLSAWLFNFYLHQLWGSWLGILAADLRDYQDPKEIFNFFLQHILLCVFPLYHIARGTFPIFPSALVANFSTYHVFHWAVLFPVSILSGWHMNYMTHPPKQVRLMRHHSCWASHFCIFLASLCLPVLASFHLPLSSGCLGNITAS